jgi:hypothetical protein
MILDLNKETAQSLFGYIQINGYDPARSSLSVVGKCSMLDLEKLFNFVQEAQDYLVDRANTFDLRYYKPPELIDYTVSGHHIIRLKK